MFQDGRYREVMPGKFGRALTLLTTLLPVKERYAVRDAGMKPVTKKFGPPMSRDCTRKVARLSEEHAHLAGERLASLRPGQKIEVIPSHGDTTLNLHDWYNVTRGGAVIDRCPIPGARKFK